MEVMSSIVVVGGDNSSKQASVEVCIGANIQQVNVKRECKAEYMCNVIIYVMLNITKYANNYQNFPLWKNE